MSNSNKHKNTLSDVEDGLINDFKALIGKELNGYELQLLSVLFKNKQLLKSKTSDIQHKINDEYSCVIKSNTSVLTDNSKIQSEASSCLDSLINSVLANAAVPIAFSNEFILNNNKQKKNKKVLEQLVNGTSSLSNTMGIPTLNSLINFGQCNHHSNFMHTASVGLINHKLSKKKAKPKSGNKVFLFGSFLRKGLESESFSDLKRINGSILDLLNSNALIYAIAIEKVGFLASCAGLIQKSGLGIELKLNAYNKNLLNTNEKLDNNYSIIVVTNNQDILLKTVDKWEVEYIELGKMVSKKELRVYDNTKLLIDLPIADAIQAITKSQQETVTRLKKLRYNIFDINNLAAPAKLRDVAWFMIEHPNIASKQCIQEQYDSMVGGANMYTNFLSDVETINLKGTDKALAFKVLTNPFADIIPETGAQLTIANLGRSMVCAGVKPIHVLANLTYTNTPLKEKLIDGIEKVSNKLNISFEFEDNNENINDQSCTSTSLAMLGILEDKNHHMTMSFKNKGNIIFLIGSSSENIAGSEYLNFYHKNNEPYLPDFNLNYEVKIQKALLDLIKKNYICSAHNVSKGGLFISLVESAMVFGFGFDIITDTDIRTDAFLFGESPGKVIVSVTANKENKFIDYMMQKDIPYLAIGHVTKGEMRVDDISYGFIDDAREKYNNSLSKILNSK